MRQVDGSTGSGGVRSWRDCDVPSVAESMGSAAELLAEIIFLFGKRQSCWFTGGNGVTDVMKRYSDVEP